MQPWIYLVVALLSLIGVIASLFVFFTPGVIGFAVLMLFAVYRFFLGRRNRG